MRCRDWHLIERGLSRCYFSARVSSTKVFNGAWRDSFPNGWTATEHLHPYSWEIMVVTQGSVEVNLPGRKYEGIAGSVFIYPPRTLHHEVATSRENLKMVGIYAKALAVREKLPVQLHDVSGRIGQGLDWICDLRDTYGFQVPVFDDLSRAILFECQRKQDRLGDPRMERVRSFIYRATREDLTIDKLAEIAALSRRHFSREFQRRTHMTPMAYVRNVRVEKARRALSQTSLSLREIAHEVGFRDEFEFSRAFRRATGFAPSAMRGRGRK